MNMAMFCAAHKQTPPIIDSVAQYITPTFLPHLSITQLPIKTPKNAPAFHYRKSASTFCVSASDAYLKYPASRANKRIRIRTEPGLSIDQSEQAHVFEESRLSKCHANDGGWVAEGQLTNEADGEADPEIVPIPLFVLCEAFGHDEVWERVFAGVEKR
jgi:hypothetical protein